VALFFVERAFLCNGLLELVLGFSLTRSDGFKGSLASVTFDDRLILKLKGLASLELFTVEHGNC